MRIPEWVSISCSRGVALPDPGIESIALTGGFFTSEPPRKSINELKTLNICSTYVCVKLMLYLFKKFSFNTSVCYFYNSGKAWKRYESIPETPRRSNSDLPFRLAVLTPR